MDKRAEEIRKKLEQRRQQKFKERVMREQGIAFEKFKKEVFEDFEPIAEDKKKERENRRKELLTFVDRYVFISGYKGIKSQKQEQSVITAAVKSFSEEKKILKNFLNSLIFLGI